LLAIDNHSSTIPMAPWEARLGAFGWHVAVVDGHDRDSLAAALAYRDGRVPSAVVADIPEGEW
jgi:transketolase N-terminal domain/subunit